VLGVWVLVVGVGGLGFGVWGLGVCGCPLRQHSRVLNDSKQKASSLLTRTTGLSQGLGCWVYVGSGRYRKSRRSNRSKYCCPTTCIQGLYFGVWGTPFNLIRFWKWDSQALMYGGRKSRVQGAGFRVQGSGFGVQGPGFRVQGSGSRVQGLGFEV